MEAGYQPGPEHFGYLLKVFVADSDEKADEIGRNFVWTEGHRQRGPREHVDPPGYQSRQALQIKRSRPYRGFPPGTRATLSLTLSRRTTAP